MSALLEGAGDNNGLNPRIFSTWVVGRSTFLLGTNVRMTKRARMVSTIYYDPERPVYSFRGISRVPRVQTLSSEIRALFSSIVNSSSIQRGNKTLSQR